MGKQFSNTHTQLVNSHFKFSSYRNNPYHNALHAADVMQTVNYMLVTCGFRESAELDQIEMASSLIAAAIHDYDHP